MRSRFWPNRILELQTLQNRHARLKFSRKRENSAPSMKIVLDALYRSCAARFGEIAFLSVKVFKIVKLAWNSLQKRKTVRFRRKLYETRFTGHAQHVFAKSDFRAPKFSKSWNWPQILAKAEKQCAFHENCTKRSFQVMRSRFWPNRIFERQSFQNRETGSKSLQSGKRVRFSGHAHFFKTEKQCAFLSVKVLKIVTLAWNSLQMGKTVRFSWKLSKTLFSGHAQHFLAKLQFWASKF